MEDRGQAEGVRWKDCQVPRRDVRGRRGAEVSTDIRPLLRYAGSGGQPSPGDYAGELPRVWTRIRFQPHTVPMCCYASPVWLI